MKTSDEAVLVGPTPCDERRAEREIDLRQMDEVLSNKMLNETHIMFGETYDLFREAMSCYQNGAFVATAVMCRAAIESSLYVAISRQPQIQRVKSIQSDVVTIDSQHMEKRRKHIIQLAKQKGLLNKRTEAQIGYILKLGDFGAHYGQKLDQAIFRTKATQSQHHHRTWVTRKDAFRTLQHTAVVFRYFMMNVSVAEYATTSHPNEH